MFIQKFVSKINQEIKKKLNSGFFKEDYFLTWDYNYQSEVHSRIQAIIVKVCYELGLNVEVERGFNYNDNGKTVRFKPDIATYKDNNLFAFIEYESTNSSDARFYDDERSTSDLRCLLKYTQSKINLPKHWIMISTLPKNEVISTRWKSWEYNKSNAEFKKIISSPFKYYFPKYVEETKKILGKIKTDSKIYLLNLDRNLITIEKEF